jgi:carboxyl-terminal processing protease
VVLLTNFGTAGAAELFAAALADAGRADTVGIRTAGRASEQTLVRLPAGGGLLLSSTRYLTASGESIHRQGVAAAVPVREPGGDLAPAAAEAPADEDQEDPVLDRALEHLAGLAEQESAP